MKLKKIVENMGKMPSTLKGFNESPKLSSEQKMKLMDMVSRYNEFGQKLKMENSLIETAQALAEISELAETYACNEAQDWFATEVVKGDFKRARGVSETFQKIAKECHGKVQQLNALYEDMGNILQRYYEISDPVQEVQYNPSNISSQRPLPNANPNSVMEVNVDAKNKNIKGQRELPHVNGPSKPQLKEVDVDSKNSNVKGQHELPHLNGPATKQVKEIAVDDKNKNIKGQRMLPAGGPSIKQLKEVDYNEDDLQSQRDLPQGGPDKYIHPTPENDSPEIDPAGNGEMNIKGERDEPVGGPAPSQIQETFKKLPSMKEIMRMK